MIAALSYGSALNLGFDPTVKVLKGTNNKISFDLTVKGSALKSSLKTAKRLQLDQTKIAKDWTCSLGLSVLKLED